MSEIDSRRKPITTGTDAYSRAASMPLTDAYIAMRPFLRRVWRLGGEIWRYENERHKAEVRGDKAEIRRLDDEHMQILLWHRSESVKDAALIPEAKAEIQTLDDNIRALLPVTWKGDALQLINEVGLEMRDKVRRLVIKGELLEGELHDAKRQGHNVEVQRLRAEFKAVQIELWESMPEGSFWGDVARMDDKRLSNQKRIEAMDRLFSNYFKVPIHPRRWNVIGPVITLEMIREAEVHKHSCRKEFRQRERSALYAVRLEAAGHFTLWEKEQAIRSLGRALNNAFTEDVLGSDWRKKDKQREFIDEEKIPDLSKIELRLILKRSDLTEREVELLSLRRRGFSYEEMAARLSASPNALSTAHHRAMEKLKKLVS